MNTQHGQELVKSVLYRLMWKICESWNTLVEKVKVGSMSLISRKGGFIYSYLAAECL